MESFLQELATRIHREHPHPDTVTMVFPNRRAALYFRKYLSKLLDKPMFSPKLLTIEDFIAGFSHYQVPDKLELVYRLYNVYRELLKTNETLDQFYFWGEMLLRDFDEVDKYLVDADILFRDLSNQKQLDASFDFLTPEQMEFLKTFWGNFEATITENKKKFLQVWRQLPEVYHAYRRQLAADGVAYQGMVHRAVADSISNVPQQSGTLVFAGFNALTKCEETVLSHFVSLGASVYWDLDEYYVNSDWQEAGDFFREYQQHPVLKKTFSADLPSNFRKPKSVRVIGAAQPVGQAKIMSQVLHEELQKGMNPEETLLVLPDEKLMLPVLHGISASVEKLNVTMGFPLSSTPLFNLVELLIELQINKRGDEFNHRQVLALLGHPYPVAASPKATHEKRKQILNDNLVYVPGEQLRTDHSLLSYIFCEATEHTVLDYLRQIIQEIGTLNSITEFDKEYALYFLKFLNRMEEVLGREYSNLKAFLRLFRQLVRAQRIPFTGEPLSGLQVMGVLETRNIDFKNVFVLSLNEGALPSGASKGSYIPFNIRKAYGLPTVEHQDSIYAYLFYRALQRAENVFLFYNTETDVLGQGEMSRYLQQLLFESGWKVDKQVLHNTIQPLSIQPIVVKKDASVTNELAKFIDGSSNSRELTPSSLSDYMECSLRFYFKQIARIREAKEVEEDMDARILGNFVHAVMEKFYLRLIDRKKSRDVEAGDLKNMTSEIDDIIDEVFREEYSLKANRKIEYDGQRLIVKEVVKKFVDRILEVDQSYAPFAVVGLEKKDLRYVVPLELSGNPRAVLSGSVDRADRKGDVLRVIDYKTGKDKTDIKGGLEELFSKDGERNKAGFQVMMYALLFDKNTPAHHDVRLVPGLINRVNLFADNFTFGLRMGYEMVQDARPLLPEFEQRLKAVLEELFDTNTPFVQTQNTDACKLCAYQAICYRG